ncbi:MerR family transcriptional regulator [Polaromonas sp. AER18D-145]|uniref:MerR family transcriptional regulator n=1 Tax=Polaromonas sp. AER18D-145 TaxID=1977060 RepID=UPI000BBC4ACC|nr:MerR family transcriptional regulator [Polaromonas sp. AER18D-145]
MPSPDPSLPGPVISRQADACAPGFTIAAVERDTGLSKDTLRVWERRYLFPVPRRDVHGERLYSREQLEQLRLIKRLLDTGHRPGQVVGLPHAELQALGRQTGGNKQRSQVQRGKTAKTATAAADVLAPQIQACFELVKRHDALGLRRTLAAAVQELGLAAFVSTLVAPLNTLIGDAWMDGRLEVFEEHFYTESVTAVLRHGISSLGVAGVASPRVLLTTFPQESHGLGLLMAETFLALQGCNCLSLGVQTPVPDIARAVSAHGAQIVVLSFSASLNPKDVTQGLGDLRGLLPPAVEIWTGGACPVLQRRGLPGVRVLDSFAAIEPELQRWRRTQP